VPRTVILDPCCRYSDGMLLCLPHSTLPAIGRAADGQLTFWDVANGKQTGSIEGRRDIAGGRALGDKVTAANR
jgi:periodic tryptophan protein 2